MSPIKRDGWTKTAYRMRDNIKARIRKILPYKGANNVTSFVDYACEEELKRIETEIKEAKRK